MAVESRTGEKGKAAEGDACIYLQDRGLTLIQKNYRCVCGELDLIMRDGEEVVFVEVRLRCQDYLGSAIESVTRAKQRKVIHAAKLYLQEMQWLDIIPCRFDVLGVNQRNEFDWVRNAFGVGFV